MNRNEFNQTTKFPRYSYTRSPVHDRAFMIMLRNAADKQAEPVGEYTVLDKEEDLSLSEKKVMNLITLLNEKPGKVISLEDEAKGRTHFQVIGVPEDNADLKVMFYIQNGNGISTENALFRVRNDDTIWN